jgi:hypothetical protein
MDYRIVLSPNLSQKATAVAAAWNEDPGARQVAQAQVIEAEQVSYLPIDPDLLQQGLIFLGGVAGGIALDVVKDLTKERVTAYLKRVWPQKPPEVEVEAVRQPDGAILLVVKEQE